MIDVERSASPAIRGTKAPPCIKPGPTPNHATVAVLNVVDAELHRIPAQSFNSIKQCIAGEEIERAQAITFMSLSLDESLLGTNGDGGMMHATGTWGWWMVWRFEA